MANTNPFGTKHFFLTVMAVVILVGVSGIVFSVDKIYQITQSVFKPNTEQTMYITGLQKVKAMPDIAYVSYTLRVMNKDVQKASVELQSKLDKAISAFVASGIDRQKIYLSQYQVNKAEIYAEEMPPSDSYASQNLTVEIKGSKEALNQALTSLNKVALGNGLSPANNGSSFICLDFSDKVTTFSAARKDAVADAYRQASDLVSAGGLSLGAIITISDNMYGFGGVNSPYGAYCSTQLGSGLTIDEQEVPVSVSVNFEIR